MRSSAPGQPEISASSRSSPPEKVHVVVVRHKNPEGGRHREQPYLAQLGLLHHELLALALMTVGTNQRFGRRALATLGATGSVAATENDAAGLALA